MPGNSKPMGGSTSNACDQCFRTKQSCSKHPVQCARCAELGSSCTYSFGKFMGRPKRSLKSRRQFQLDTESTPQKQRETPVASSEGPDEVQNPTLLSTPLTSDETISPDWWQYSRIEKETFNYRFNTEDVKNKSTKGDESQQTSKKVPAPPKTSACDQCYRFKVKCTRESDCCQRCSLNGNACTYSASTDLERSRKRSAPPSIGSPKTKVPLLSKLDPVTNADDFGKSSTTTESHGNGSETFFSKELIPLQPQSLHQTHQGSLPAPDSSHSHEIFTVPHEQTHIMDECDISLSDSSHCYTDILLSVPPLDSFFNSDNSPHNIEFNMSENGMLEHSHSSEATTKHNSNVPILEDTSFSSCGCLQSVLLSLSNLHAVVGNNLISSSDSIFAAARNGLFICESLTLTQCSCQSSSLSTLLMLCVAILQQVYNAYELLAIPPMELFTGATDGSDKKIALSIKIGDMEFTDIGHSPSIMKAILKMEKAKAERICVELEKMAASISHCGNFSGAGKDETMVQESLIRLIEVFRGRFITEVI